MDDAPAISPKPVLSLTERRPPKPTPTVPLDLLEEFVADVKAGKIVPISVAIHYVEETAEKTDRPRVWTANMSYEREIALCEFAKLQAMEDWRT